MLATWPLARGVARDVPSDFGDPLLHIWLQAWNSTHLGRGWWNANIFYPHPLALAYSDHLLPLALETLPIYVITRNPILCYNLVYLSTFVLSGLGMFLFVRELTGSRAAAFVAGLAYAFTPYRMGSLPHVQVLSSQWVPFALYGLRRYFTTGRVRALAGGASAWIVENLTNGYYLYFFSPVIILYLVWEIATRRRLRDARALSQLAFVMIVVAAVTIPFLLPYRELRQQGFEPRPIGEVSKFAADVYAYATADPNLWVWGGTMRAYEKPEGALFPGLTIALLAAMGTIRSWRAVRAPGRDTPGATLLAIGLTAAGAVTVSLLLGRRLVLPGFHATSVSRSLAVVCVLGAALLVVSSRARQTLVRWAATPAGLFAPITILAAVLSFGPTIAARGRVVASGTLYAVLYSWVPGFDALRVPARFAMVVAFALAVLAGIGVATIRSTNARRRVALIASFVIVAETLAVPIPLNTNDVHYKVVGLGPLSDSLFPAPAVYGFIARLPGDAAVLELPLGEPAFDVRYMFYSIGHWKPLVNGYSGGAPASYAALIGTLQDLPERGDIAWQQVLVSHATHVVLHESYYAGDRGQKISRWLLGRGAREIATFGSDRVFAVR